MSRTVLTMKNPTPFDEIVVARLLAGQPVGFVHARDREEAVRRMAVDEYTDPQIARRIGCSLRTVQRVRSRLSIPGRPVGTNEHTRKHDALTIPWRLQ